jgi:NADH:ubiquinone oxidoreductase subunit E
LRALFRILPQRRTTREIEADPGIGDRARGMTHRSIALITARLSAAVVALLVMFLFADYAIATGRKPKDDARIAELQEKAQTNASFAGDLADEHNRITRARAARKARLYWLSLVLIAVSATFIGSAKWLLELDGHSVGSMRRAGRVALQSVPATSAPSVQPRSAAPAVDWAFVDRIAAQEGTLKEAAIPILQAIQEHYRYLPEAALQRVCELSQITPAQIAGTSTFYSRFRRTPVGEHLIRVCHGTACYVSGARQITEELRRHLHIPEGATTDPEGKFTVEEIACLGCCSLAPVLMLDDRTAGKLTPAGACDAVEAATQKEPV